MERYFKRKSSSEQPSSPQIHVEKEVKLGPPTKKIFLECDLERLPDDPCLRPKISDYHPSDRDEVKRYYLQKGPYQPKGINFPKRQFGDTIRKFNPDWYLKYGNWLEYSQKEDATYCLYCYLMRSHVEEHKGSGDVFITEGFPNWKKNERFQVHVGGPNSFHNQAWRNCQSLMKQKKHIEVAMCKQSDQTKKEYQIHLTVIVDCIRFLLCQGLAFRGNDESMSSSNKGNFLELLDFLAKHNEVIHKVIKNARGNLKLIAPTIQKDIVRYAASETTKAILDDLGDNLFAILIDESRDISVKEKMVVVLRYVNKNTNVLSLKMALDSLFSKYGLSLSRLRGQGYDGASNMQGEFNGLKSLILKENCSAFYIHCFAHQLQLALVTVAKKHVGVALFFNLVANISNVVGASCKRRDILRESQIAKVKEALQKGEISSGHGLNQETKIKKAGDTRWSSHYDTLLSLLSLFPSMIDVLEIVEEDGMSLAQKGEECALLNSMQTFEFVFTLHLMKNILGTTHELSQALQRSDQDIVNAMKLVSVSKQRLQAMRDDGWSSLLNNVSSFCENHNIVVLNMNDTFQTQGRSRHRVEQVSNLHHFQVELFFQVIDQQLQELNNCFTEANTELLLCVACLNPRDSFSTFDKEKLIRFAQFYSSEFSPVELLALDNQLENYFIDVCFDSAFSKLEGIGDLSMKLVETRKHVVYPLAYLLLELALILPVATASVERAFSTVNIIKNRMCNRMGDEWLNDCLVTYKEREVFDSIENEQIIQCFQTMKTRREQL
uniref:Zinc finger MYM-type protein 1 n=1 Tax=Cajanus cajan TaxID=3821 RepID=A0A151RZ90_CAJCA|nr:Zinc finger MYM-type protein 1 [Cajanus cajan]